MTLMNSLHLIFKYCQVRFTNLPPNNMHMQHSSTLAEWFLGKCAEYCYKDLHYYFDFYMLSPSVILFKILVGILSHFKVIFILDGICPLNQNRWWPPKSGLKKWPGCRRVVWRSGHWSKGLRRVNKSLLRVSKKTCAVGPRKMEKSTPLHPDITTDRKNLLSPPWRHRARTPLHCGVLTSQKNIARASPQEKVVKSLGSVFTASDVFSLLIWIVFFLLLETLFFTASSLFLLL